MNNTCFEVLILGGSIAALKCVSILAGLLGRGASIGLLTMNTRFAFLPLIPDVISGRVSTDFASADLDIFCARRGITYMQTSVRSIQPETSKVVFSGGGECHYNTLVVATGSPANSSCDQEYWQQVLRKICDSEQGGRVILANPGVASYEVALALASVQRNERLLVQTTSRQRRFSTHPWLGHVREFRKYVLLADTFVCENVSSEASGADGINPAQMAPSLRMDGIVQDRGLSGEPSIHLIGTHLAFLSGVSGSAQYSSFTAKRAALVIWMMSLMPQKLERVASVFRDYPFKSRGAMLSSGPNCAGIWLGSHSPIGRPPALTGPVAATIRRLFYCAQIRLFYSTKPMPRIILKSYALLVLVGSVPWLAKAYFSSESTTKLRSRG